MVKESADSDDGASSHRKVVTPRTEDRSTFWAEKLKASGIGCLSVKFSPDWTVDNKSLEAELSPSDVASFRRETTITENIGKPLGMLDKLTMSYIGIGTFGSDDIKKKYYNIPSNMMSQDLQRSVDLKKRTGINHLFIYPQHGSEYLPSQGNVASATYLMWGNPADIPDSRGNLLPFQFSFIINPTDMGILITDVKKNPDLIENVFQKMYPRLTGENGLKRKSASELVINEAPTNYQQLVTSQSVGYFFNQNKPVPYSTPVGEVLP